jgi:hypothetical protein
MLETDAADRPDEEVLVVRSGDGQFADVHEEDADDVGEAAFGGARRPDVIFGRRLPDPGGKATWRLPEADERMSDEKVRAIGDPPARLDDLSRISNRAGCEERPRD